ncbi:SCP2 sterol-binding domain-containing protein [Marinospirillum perlucidum]|uniref:SCP2 sterol-binding domain-containing protein n=1 Tax=Marinospirillum perlucidum TaxID=1982602 RepID=UPI000DF484BA|nr:SCP2 sterol-binding domain-containing protein [Marinospirillum perlucidum]
MLRLRFLLWMLGRLLTRAHKKNPQVREKLRSQPLNFVIKTRDWKGRSYQLQEDKARTQAGDLDEADMKLIFESADQAWQTLTNKDRNAFMRALQDGHVKVEGDPKRLFQLQGLMKHLGV